MSTTTLRCDRHEIAEAKSNISLDRIVGETVPLFKVGPRRKIGCCPIHADKSPSLTLFDDGHWHCFGCGAHGDVVDWLVRVRGMSFIDAMAHLGATPPEGRPQAAQPARAPSMPSPTLDAAHRVWTDALPARGTLAEKYLATRGLSLPEDAPIRFHPECQRGPRDRSGCAILAPAMICLMRDPVTGKSTGVHRTYVTHRGAKAPPITRGDRILPSKAILGSWGCIRIAPENETRGALAIAEGLENALSAQIITEWEWGPASALGCAHNVEVFPVLSWATSLCIFADSDDVGQKAARECAARWRDAGRHVEIEVPPRGQDWNDVLRAGRTR